MLRAALFFDFKGSDTLLIWGDNSGMAQLCTGLLETRRSNRPVFVIEGGPGLTTLQIGPTPGDWVSKLSGAEDAAEWICSPDILDDCLRLVEPLLTSTQGHQFVDVRGGLADQVMISVNEYPDGLQRQIRLR